MAIEPYRTLAAGPVFQPGKMAPGDSPRATIDHYHRYILWEREGELGGMEYGVGVQMFRVGTAIPGHLTTYADGLTAAAQTWSEMVVLTTADLPWLSSGFRVETVAGRGEVSYF